MVSKLDWKRKTANHGMFAAAMVFLCLLPSLSWALDQKEALRGLTGVKVVVEHLNPEVERLGLQKSQIQSDVEERLRRVGIKVLKDYKPPAMTALYINVHTLNTSGKSVVIYSINVMLLEYAYLKREAGSVGDLREVRTADWFNGTLGYLATSNIQEIRKKVVEQVERFISDYLAANQR